MWEKIKKALVAAGLWPEDESQAAKMETALKGLDLDAGAEIKIDTSGMSKEMQAVVTPLQDAINALKQQNKDLMDALSAEKASREQAIKTQQEEAKKAQEKKVEKLVAEAIGTKEKPGKITEAKKEWFQSFAEKDFDAAKEWLDGAPADPHLEKGEDDKSKSKSKSKDKANPMLSGVGGADPALLKSVEEMTTVVEAAEA